MAQNVEVELKANSDKKFNDQVNLQILVSKQTIYTDRVLNYSQYLLKLLIRTYLIVTTLIY